MPKLLMLLRAAFTTPAVRYPPDPRALFLLILLVIVGVPLIFANATPGTIASQLDAPWVVAWGVMLSGGSALSLLGAVRQTPNGVIAEEVGSVALGFACLIYGCAIWGKVGWAGSVPMGILLALGVASIVRYFQLRAYLRNVERQAQQIRDVEALGPDMGDE